MLRSTRGFASGFSSVGQAEVIGSGALIHSSQNAAECLFINLSAVTVSFNSVKAYNCAGVAKTLSLDSCNSPLPPNRLCAFQATIPNVGGHFCKANVSGDAAGLRGEFHLIDNNEYNLTSTTMR
jgi:hypothetical protein